MTTISDEDQLKKKIKIEKPLKQPQQLRIPLRNRRPEPASPPRSLDTEPVFNTSRKLPQLKPKAVNEPPPPPPLPIEETSSEEVFQTEWDEQVEAEQKAKTAALSSRENEKRTLRSHDGGSRSKSELAQYFQNYEQMISLDPTIPEIITPKTTITFIDDQRDADIDNTSSASAKRKASKTNGLPASRQLPPTFASIPLHNAQRLDLSILAQAPRRSIKDPMSTDIYIKAHRRPERQEKQLRNIEKERAQHEKVQLDRILEELKGPDWLRTMGISGITETEKKLYEPKRFYFIKEVTALIEKFKYWKEEEKRRKLERDQAILEQMNEETDDVEDDDEAESEASSSGDEEEEDGSVSEAEANAEEQSPHSSPTNSSDLLDAQAARQLLQEASSANLPPHPRSPKVYRPRKKAEPSNAPGIRSRAKPRQQKTQILSSDHPDNITPRTKHSTRPIHSFFHKPSPPAALQNPHHTRQQPPGSIQDDSTAAVHGHRRGRAPKTTAFGKAVQQAVEETVPSEMSDKDFDLPNGLVKHSKRTRTMFTKANATANTTTDDNAASITKARRSRRTATVCQGEQEEVGPPAKSAATHEQAGRKNVQTTRRSTRTKA